MATGRTCFHSQLPLAIREVFVYDYQETILVCSATSGQNKVNLQCFVWDVSAKEWREFSVAPFDNTVVDLETNAFISSARLPGKDLMCIIHIGQDFTFSLRHSNRIQAYRMPLLITVLS